MLGKELVSDQSNSDPKKNLDPKEAVEWLRTKGNYGDTPVASEYRQRKEALSATARSVFRRADLYAGNFLAILG